MATTALAPRRGKTAATLFFAAFALAATCYTTVASAQSLQDGLNQLNTENFSAARNLLQAYSAKNPTDVQGCFTLGAAYAGLAKQVSDAKGTAKQISALQDSATQAYERAVKANPKDAYAYIAAARVALAEGKRADVAPALEKAARAGRKSADIVRYVAQTYTTVKDYPKALETLKDFIDKDDKNAKNPTIYMALGDLYADKNEAGDAVSNYKNAVFYDKTNALASLKIARFYRGTLQPGKDNSAAAREMNTALEAAKEAQPSFAPIYKEAAEAYYDLRQYDKAKTNFAKYLEMSPNDKEARVQYLNILFYAKEYKAAIKNANDILALDPKNVEVYRAIGYAQSELGDSIQAVASLEKYFQGATAKMLRADDYRFYADGLLKLKKDSLAFLNYDKAAMLDTSNVELPVMLAEKMTKLNDYPRAAKYYAMVVQRKGKNASTQEYFDVGFAQYYAKAYDKAEAYFTKVIERKPDAPVGYYWAGLAASQIDLTDAAARPLPFFTKVVEVSQKDTKKYEAELKVAYNYLAVHFCKAKDITQANDFATKLLAADPTNDTAKTILAGGCK